MEKKKIEIEYFLNNDDNIKTLSIDSSCNLIELKIKIIQENNLLIDDPKEIVLKHISNNSCDDATLDDCLKSIDFLIKYHILDPKGVINVIYNINIELYYVINNYDEDSNNISFLLISENKNIGELKEKIIEKNNLTYEIYNESLIKLKYKVDFKILENNEKIINYQYDLFYFICPSPISLFTNFGSIDVISNEKVKCIKNNLEILNFAKKIEIVFNNKKLNKKLSWIENEITKNETININVLKPNYIISFINNDGEEINIDIWKINSTDTVYKIKQEIEKFDLLKINEQSIFVNDKEMKDDDIIDNFTEKKGLGFKIKLMKSFKHIQTFFNEKIYSNYYLKDNLIKLEKKEFEKVSGIPKNYQFWFIKKNREQKILEDDLTFAKFIEKNNLYDINKIFIDQFIDLGINYGQKLIKLFVPIKSNILELKKNAENEIQISSNQQKWISNKRQILENEVSLEEYLKKKKKFEPFKIDVEFEKNYEYFGFVNKFNLDKEMFESFYLEQPNEVDLILNEIKEIRDIEINKNLEDKNNEIDKISIIFKNRINYLFLSYMKKHFVNNWLVIIVQIRNRSYQVLNFDKLWRIQKNENYNDAINIQFLIHFYLNSANSACRFYLIKSLKEYFPIPLYINSWDNNYKDLELKFIYENGFFCQNFLVLVSFGIGKLAKVSCGKSNFLNNVFDTKFELSENKHPITKGVPEIQYNAYKNEDFPFSIIDIPNNFELDRIDYLCDHSNFLIVHYFFDESDKIIEFEKKYKEKNKFIIKIIHINEIILNKNDIKIENNLLEIKFCEKIQEAHYNTIKKNIHELIFNNFLEKNVYSKEFWKFSEIFSNENENTKEFNKILEKIVKDDDLFVVLPFFKEFINLQKIENRSIEEQNLYNNLLKKSEKIAFSKNFNDLINFLEENSNNIHIYLDILSKYLKSYKIIKFKKYNELYDIKSKLMQGQQNESLMKLEEFLKLINSNQKVSAENAYKICEELILDLENNLKPNFQSIELIWREIIYFVEIQEKTNKNFSFKNYISLFRKYLFSGYPFEIIDGDLLYMPKSFLKQVFQNEKQKTLVISVIGPQSSGKSTLLNFLFGCDFYTSSGRCTKGVYGTFIKTVNIKDCPNILVIDTEGIISIEGENTKIRSDFDKKMILFCLTISDIVLVSCKGDMNEPMKNVINYCLSLIIDLKFGNFEMPDFYIVINQDTDKKINNHRIYINKLFDDLYKKLKEKELKMLKIDFTMQNLICLGQAFKIKTKQIDMKLNNKKFSYNYYDFQPSNDFLEDTNIMCNKIIYNRINNIPIFRRLENIFDEMENIWQLVNSYSHILKFDSIDQREQENYLKIEIEKIIENFSKWINDIIEKNLNETNEDKINKIILNIYDEKIKYENEFNILFLENKKFKLDLVYKLKNKLLISQLCIIQDEAISKLEISLFTNNLNNEKNLIWITNEKLIEEINEKKINDEKTKKLLFDEKFNKLLENLKINNNREKYSKRLYETIYTKYECVINSIGCKIHLPNRMINLSLENENLLFEYKQEFIKKYEKSFFEKSNKPPVFIQRRNLHNLNFEYFDINKYFTKKNVSQNTLISEKDFFESINFIELEKIYLKNKYNKNNNIKILNELNKELEIFKICLDYETFNEMYNYYLYKNFQHNLLNIEIEKVIKNSFEKKYEVIIKNNLKKTLKSLSNENIMVILENKKFLNKNFIDNIFENNQYKTEKNIFENIIKFVIGWDKILFENSDEIIDYTIKIFEQECLNFNIRITDKFIKVLRNYFHLKDKNKLIKYKNDYFEINFDTNFKEDIKTIFFNIDNIKRCLFLEKENVIYDNHIILSKIEIEKIVIKNQYEHIEWLHFYLQEDLNYLLKDYSIINQIKNQVISDFKFIGFIEKIEKKVLNELKDKNNVYQKEIFFSIFRKINNEIEIANSELEHVSSCFTFDFVGNLHFIAILYCWKYFESYQWSSFCKNLELIENEIQKTYINFKNLTSENNKKIDEENSDKFFEIFNKKIEDYIQKIKKEIIDQTLLSTKDVIFNRGNVLFELCDNILALNSKNKKDKNDLYDFYINTSKYLEEELELRFKDKFFVLVKEKFQQKLQQNNIFSGILNYLKEKIIFLKNNLINDKLENKKLVKFYNIDDDKNKILINKYLFKIFLDWNLDLTIESQYNDNEIIMLINKDFFDKSYKNDNNNFTEISTFLQILNEIKNDKVFNCSIISLNYFIDCLICKIDEKIKNTQFEIKLEEIEIYKNALIGYICDKKCPFCLKCCDNSDFHHRYHSCSYGHYKNLYLEKDQLEFCNEIKDNYMINFNGKKQNWIYFKKEFENKIENPWIYENYCKEYTQDKENIDNFEELFLRVFEILIMKKN